MSKHTPGPWKFDDGLILSPDGLRIADLICEDQPGISLGETTANSNLIVASPDLKDALQDALPELELWKARLESGFVGGFRGEYDKDIKALEALISAAKTALAKTEGKGKEGGNGC